MNLVYAGTVNNKKRNSTQTALSLRDVCDHGRFLINYVYFMIANFISMICSTEYDLYIRTYVHIHFKIQ